MGSLWICFKFVIILISFIRTILKFKIKIQTESGNILPCLFCACARLVDHYYWFCARADRGFSLHPQQIQPVDLGVALVLNKSKLLKDLQGSYNVFWGTALKSNPPSTRAWETKNIIFFPSTPKIMWDPPTRTNTNYWNKKMRGVWCRLIVA